MISKFFFAGDKLMPQMHLRQPRFTYGAWGLFAISKDRIQNFIEIGD